MTEDILKTCPGLAALKDISNPERDTLRGCVLELLTLVAAQKARIEALEQRPTQVYQFVPYYIPQPCYPTPSPVPYPSPVPWVYSAGTIGSGG